MHLPILDPLLVNELHARVFAMALRGGELETIGLCLCREAGVSLTFNENRAEYAERVIELAKDVFRDSPHSEHRAWLALGDGLRCYFTGQFERAMTLFRSAQDIWSAEAESNAMNISQVTVFTLGSLRYTGDINELRREFEQARRDAEWRGNRHMWAISTIAFQLPLLLQDGVEASQRDLARVDMDASFIREGANHWYLDRTHAEEALYRGADVVELMAHVNKLSRILRTQYAFVVTWGSEVRWLLGRLWLALADLGDSRGTRKAARFTKSLLRRRLPYSHVWGRALLAGVHKQRGDRTSAREALEDCAVRAELNGLVLVANAARIRLCENGFGSEETRRDALSFFDKQRVIDLEAVMRLYMPGFGGHKALLTPPRRTKQLTTG